MSKILELRTKRNTLWEQTKDFLEKNRGENGLVKAEAVEQYNKMAQEVKDLGAEIERLEQQAQIEAQLSAPTSSPVHADPKNGAKKDVKPTATAEYAENFWNMIRKEEPMTHEEVKALVEEMGLPYAYDHFAEGESPDPPFICFLYPKAENFGADNLVYHHFNQLDIEVYTDYKDPDMEASIEEVLTAHELYYEKSEVWIETEKMYEVLYELTV